MEPFITLDVESGSIGAMAKELNTLHDLMDTLLNHTGAATSSLAATVGVLSDSAARATESARYVAERTTDYVDNTVSTVNESVHPHQHGGENARSRDHGVFHGGRVARQGDRLLQQGL